MRVKLIILIFLLPLAAFNCKQTNKTKSPVELITVEEMDSMLKVEEVRLIDIRTPEEYKGGHIPGAINIDFRDKNFEKLMSKVDKTKPIAIYCGYGRRSSKCSEYMKKAGFIKIYDLDGGIIKWKFKGNPVVK